VVIPPNCSAEVSIPTSQPNRSVIHEGDELVWDGKFHANVAGISSARSDDATVTLEVASGVFEFVVS
jgi:hypothetical protein